MKNKLFLLFTLLTVLILTACGGENNAPDDDTAVPDWRNSIEYEGSFFVERERKLLYALEKGKIILWDNGGDGSILQTVEYDTSVDDAIDRMETDDVNGDGFADIRMIYSEKEGEAEYNLWLWTDAELKFTECRDYRFVPNPETVDGGKVKSSVVVDGFGTLERIFAFNGENGLTEESFKITDADSVAEKISGALMPDFASMAPAEGNATVEECSCPAYILFDKAGNPSFLAYSDKGVWYIDNSCMGLYRTVVSSNGVYSVGEYVGEAGSVRNTVSKMNGSENSDITITDIQKGVVGNNKATLYKLTAENGSSVFVVAVKKGLWYYSENGEDYSVLDSKSCTVGEGVSIEFVIPTEPEEDGGMKDVPESSD